MRLIYEKGEQIGPDPLGYYVYLWRHGETDIYVGRGGGNTGRWSDHLAANPNDDNQCKARYFAKNEGEMDAFIITEGLASEADGAVREAAEAEARGYKFNGSGALLNARRPAAFYGRAPAGQRKDKGPFEWRLFERLRKEGPFAPNALFYKIVPDCLKKNTGGRRYFEEIYPPLGEAMTVAEVLARGKKAGFRDSEQSRHMACDFCRGLIGMALPEGETIAPGHIVPTKTLIAKLALDVGTEAEWLRHCALRERLGCKIGG